MQQKHNKIKHLVELALGQKIKYQPNTKDLLTVPAISVTDELALVKHYLNNANLVTEQLINDLVVQQLKNYKFAVESCWPKAQTWHEYIDKLEQILDQVKYRKAQNFEYQSIMPSHKLLRQLLEECWGLTEKWYGFGKGNISCFYNYFIAMSQAAGITCFEYKQIAKFISADHFISLINVAQRRSFYTEHETKYHHFQEQGGYRAKGRSAIDTTTICNVFYYKAAQLMFNYEFAKKIITDALQLENYGQLPYETRIKLWHLMRQHYQDDTPSDQASIFYKYVQFLNDRPGEYFNYFAADLPESNKIPPRTFHDAIKIAGLQNNYLILLSRDLVDNFIPKRHLNIQWQRKYPLIQINDYSSSIILRNAGVQEVARILPNELPYAPGHGLSLCSEGLSDDEWNTPIDTKAEIDNWARDIEKLFREFEFFCPQIKHKNMLPGEKFVSMFHNSMAYSTIHTTQHTHILSGSVDSFKLYCLEGDIVHDMPALNARVEIVKVGSKIDAIFLKIVFSEIHNESLIQFLMQLNNALFMHFGGVKNIDVHLQIFATEQGDFVFIYEPHAFLTQLDFDKFLNPHTNIISPRRPQFLQPEGDTISFLTDEMSAGLQYCRKFFDDICMPGVYKFIADFIRQY